MKRFVLALATLDLADAISFMIVTPSLAFYIKSLGGSQDFYGFVLAIYSFCSFLGKPILGRWSDASNFSMPFRVSISLSVVGGLLYAIAPAFASTKSALASLALGRILGGFGKANSALTFAYVARACEANDRTSISTLLGGVQMVGMVVAPLLSVLLSNVDFDLFGIHFDNLNSVGLLLVLLNMIPQVMICLYLPDIDTPTKNSEGDENDKDEWSMMFGSIIKNPHIAVPFLTIFVFNFNWQLIETALAPSARDALDLGPTQISYILGIMAVLVFAGMTTVHHLSKSGAKDFNLLIFGMFVNSIGYALMYMLWFRGVHFLAFVFPVVVVAGSFPFLGATNRSLFAKAVDKTPELAAFKGTMQALLSMSSSVAGFTAPALVTHFCLRSSVEVETSHDSREFTPLTLLCPLISLSGLTAIYLAGDSDKNEIELVEEKIDESTPLNQKTNTPQRCSLREAKLASIRGNMVCSMPMMPQTGDIYDDDEDSVA